jgi:hypothetical protein
MSKARKYRVPGKGTKVCHGGYLKEVPKPHKRWYDDKRRKRVVQIEVMVFWGIGHHYYVNIKEDWNGIWNAKDELWQECWDDPKARGKQFDKKFDNCVLAAEWVKQIQKKHFPKRTHKLEGNWDNLQWREDKAVWLGIFKEGD